MKQSWACHLRSSWGEREGVERTRDGRGSVEGRKRDMIGEKREQSRRLVSEEKEREMEGEREGKERRRVLIDFRPLAPFSK